jgi:predicted SnoaL-like aldol condensation-catalyzing enzyme
MKRSNRLISLVAVLIACAPSFAQTPVTGVDDPEALVKSHDKKLQANKQLILDLFREVLEAHHTELITKYLAPDFIQHNPSAANGAEALASYFKQRFPNPEPIAAKVKRKIVAILAEGDMVVVIYPQEFPDPKDPAKKYTTSGFDAYRIKDGKVVEHWDNARK